MDIAKLGLEVDGTKAITTVREFGTAAEKASRQGAGLEASNRKLAASKMDASKAAERLRGSIQSIAGAALSTAPGVATLAGSVGMLGLGSVTTVGVLAGLAAIGFAYEALTSKAREARVEQDRLLDSLRKVVKEQNQGMLGGTMEQLQAAHARQAELNNSIATSTGGEASAEFGGVSLAGAKKLEAQKRELEEVNKLVAGALQRKQTLETEAAERAARERESAHSKHMAALKRQHDEEHAALEAQRKLRMTLFDRELDERARKMQAAANRVTRGAIGGGPTRAGAIEPGLNPAPEGEGYINRSGSSEAGLVEMRSSTQALQEYAGHARSIFRDLTRVYKEGSAAGGLLQGAISGFSAGKGNPIVTAVGAFAGLTAGLLGSASAARKHTEELRKLKESFDSSLSGMAARAAGPGSAEALNAEFRGINTDSAKLRAEARALVPLVGREVVAGMIDDIGRWERALVEGAQASHTAAENERALTREREKAAALAEAAAKAESRARFAEDLGARYLDVIGRGAEAAVSRFDARQRQEMVDATAGGHDSAFLRSVQALERAAFMLAQKVDAQIAFAQKEMDVAREMRAVQEQQLDATRRVVESLRSFSDSLKLGPLSTLSPVQQLAEAKRQYDTLLGSAYAGDQNAAMRLAGAGSAYLEASRNVNASGTAYVADFQRVQATLAGVTDQFGARMSIEEKMLTEATKQTAALERMLEFWNSDEARSGAWIPGIGFAGKIPIGTDPFAKVDANGNKYGTPEFRPELFGNDAAVSVLQAGFKQVVDRLDAQNAQIAENTRQVKKVQPSVT